MLKTCLLFISGLFFYLIASINCHASDDRPATHQTEQDKARQSLLMPSSQEYAVSSTSSKAQTLHFPHEEVCKYINEIVIQSDDEKLTHKLLGKLTRQATSKCLGIKSIQLLARALQNELIARGYVTSLIDIPPQEMVDGVLTLTLVYGRVGEMTFDSNTQNDTTSLWNTLPTSSGDILRLPDLEMGMANMQRLPGSSAHMKLQPGKHYAESDIVITRKLDKMWQIGAWLDDAGSRASGRYQGGAALYLYDLTSLDDILYLAAGGDVEYNQKNDGNHNSSIYYSVPLGYWTISTYASHSTYLQQFKGNYSVTDYESKNRYYSATVERLLSHTRTQKTSLSARIFKSSSRYYFGGSELAVMRKQNPAWELGVRHQRYFDNKVVDAGITLQHHFGWLSSTATPEEKAGLYNKQARVVRADIKGLMKFDATGDNFTWAPQLNVQISPDNLSTDNTFNIGSRWSVRGFDGENTLSSSQGWFLRNDLIWQTPVSDQQVYLGLDIGKIIGSDRYQKGKVLSGAVVGLRGELMATQYDMFIGTPITKPESYHTDALNMGFSLQWRY